MNEFRRVEAVLRGGHGREFTGAVARIEHGGRVVFERAYGATRADRFAQPVYCDTRFDLASLTKLSSRRLRYVWWTTGSSRWIRRWMAC